MIKKYINMIIASAFINGCFIISSSPYVQIKNGFDGEGIAVLNFSTHGNYISSDLGRIAADKFTDELFISKNFSVVDRSKVNEAQRFLEIASTESLSDDDIQKLGLRLKSKYLVLGRIQQISKSDFLDNDKQLYLSFRIISISDSYVVGVGSYSCSYSDNVIEKLESIVCILVDDIEIQ